jgi:PAS domain S-box-containing protein
MKKPAGQSIRQLLLTTIGALVLAMALVCGMDLYQDAKRLEHILALDKASRLGDEYYDAMDKLSLERDITLSILLARDQDTIDQLKARLLESRRSVDSALTAATASIKAYKFSELDQLRPKLMESVRAFTALRPAVDAAIGGAAPENERLMATWSTVATTLIENTQTLWAAFMGHFSAVDPVATQHLQYKAYLRTIVDYTGRERSMIGQLLASNSGATSRQIAKLLRGRGITQTSWAGAKTIAEQSGLQKQVGGYLLDAESHYSTMEDMVQDLFLIPGPRPTTRYPISPALWFELSNEAADSLRALTVASRSATQLYLKALVSETRTAIAVRGVFMLLAILLCARSVWIVVVRVSRPINQMIHALESATRGRTVDLQISSSGDEIGRLLEVLCAFQETAEQARRSAALLDKSERRLRAVLDGAVDGVITVDAEGVVATVNPACSKIFGYADSEIVGQPIDWLFEDPSIAMQAAQAAPVETAPARRESILLRKDGTRFPGDISISAFRTEDGIVVSAIVRDITARREAEAALASHVKALERSNKELDDFAYIASHDLKEPLRGIHNHSRFLLEDNQARLDPEDVRRLNRLLYLSKRMERLVNDLLYFSRLGRQELAFQTTDICDVIEDIRGTLEHFLEERDAQIRISTPLPCVFCDRTRVTEVFRNLITNAVKYNDKVRKSIEIGFLPISIAPDSSLGRNVFYVKDNGKGIEPEFFQEVFRIFRRLKSADQLEEGTGVGLTFVKKIVERHGGRIWLESTLGEGTTFYFTLEGEDNGKFNAEAA